jgi:hypothetical protein
MSEINSVSELQLQMEKVGVLLSLSSLESLLDSTGLVVKLFSNIISSPEESKFRSIKVSNEQINRRLIQRKGCVELLQACQWKSEAKDGEKFWVLDIKEDGSDIVHLQLVLDWLEATVASYKNYHFGSGRVDSDLLAEVTLQLRMPNGTSILGGFMSADTLSRVKLFAQSYFSSSSGKRELVRLQQPHDNDDTAFDQDLSVTLHDKHLGRRANLIVCAHDQEGAESRMVSARDAVIKRGGSVDIGEGIFTGAGAKSSEETKAIEAAKRAKRDNDKKKEIEARLKQRERALQNFRGDREKQTNPY